MSDKKISIIIPSFNRLNLIKTTLNSVLDQSYLNWECIVIDDGSTDGTQDVIKQYVKKDDRFVFFQRYRNPKGAPTCRNIGALEKAKGDFILFLDSDDLLSQDSLQKRIEQINQNPNLDFWVSLSAYKDGDKDGFIFNYKNEERDLIRFLRSDLPWTISGPIWNKEFFIELNGFDESFPNCQDHDLHTRALLNYPKYKCFNVVGHYYVSHTENKIYNPNDPLKIMIGLSMLIFKHIENVNTEDEKMALGISIKYAIKTYAINGEVDNARKLLKLAHQNEIFNNSYNRLISIYIYLCSLSIFKIKGFLKIWDLILSKYGRNSSWATLKSN